MEKNYVKLGDHGNGLLCKRKDSVDSQAWPEYVTAIKRSSKEGNAKQVNQETLTKKELVESTLDNGNIVKYYGFLENEADETLFVMEPCHGNLEELIQSGRQFTLKELSHLTNQILNGFSHLDKVESSGKENALRIFKGFMPEQIQITVKGVPLDAKVDWKAVPVDDIVLKLNNIVLQSLLTSREECASSYLEHYSWLSPNDDKLEIYSVGAILHKLATGESYPQTGTFKETV